MVNYYSLFIYYGLLYYYIIYYGLLLVWFIFIYCFIVQYVLWLVCYIMGVLWSGVFIVIGCIRLNGIMGVMYYSVLVLIQFIIGMYYSVCVMYYSVYNIMGLYYRLLYCGIILSFIILLIELQY